MFGLLHQRRHGGSCTRASLPRLAAPRPLAMILHGAACLASLGWDAAKENPECSDVGESCLGTRCCAYGHTACCERDAAYAECLSFCEEGAHQDDGRNWSCRVLEVLPQKPIPPFPAARWQRGLTASYGWDCQGTTCDRPILDPFSADNFVASPPYAPMDPADHGGSVYGETLWLTAGVSGALADELGPSDGCCGFDGGGRGGCGRCFIVRNPSATNSKWMAVVMKKSQCPPGDPRCAGGARHLVLAVPGFDDSGGNSTCGGGAGTFISRDQASVCGRWHEDPGAQDTVDGCSCDAMPDDIPEREVLKDGCWTFARWGWSGPMPQLEYQPVECPPRLVRQVGHAFGKDGVQPVGPPPSDMPLALWIFLGTCSCVCLAAVSFLGIRRRVLTGQRPPRDKPGQDSV